MSWFATVGDGDTGTDSRSIIAKMQIVRQIVKSTFLLKNRCLIGTTNFKRRIYMGSGSSFPSEQEALAAGITQEQIEEHKKKLSAASGHLENLHETLVCHITLTITKVGQKMSVLYLLDEPLKSELSDR